MSFTIYIQADLADFDSPLDVRRSATPAFWAGTDVQFNIGVFKFGSLRSVSDLASVTVEIKAMKADGSRPDPAAPALMSKTITSFNKDLLEDEWYAFEDCHVKVPFSAEESAIVAGDHWLIVSAVTDDDDAPEYLTLCAGTISVEEDGRGVSGETSTDCGLAYTKVESDARFSRSVSEEAVLYVCSGGSDETGFRGRADRPFSTLSGAFAAASAGDLVHVMPGTFPVATVNKSLGLVFEPGAVLEGPLTIAATGVHLSGVLSVAASASSCLTAITARSVVIDGSLSVDNEIDPSVILRGGLLVNLHDALFSHPGLEGDSSSTGIYSSTFTELRATDTTLQANIDAEATTARAAESANAAAVSAETARAQAIEAGKAALAGSGTQDFSMLDGTVAGDLSVSGTATLDPCFPSQQGQSFSSNISIGEAAFLEDAVSDKLQFLPAANISVEYTEDGTTWTDCGFTSAQKNQLVLGRIITPDSSTGIIYTLPNGCHSVRLTFENSLSQSWLQWLYAWFSCASPMTVAVSGSDHDGTTWTNVYTGTVAAQQPGHLFVTHPRICWGSTNTAFSKYARVVLTPNWTETDTGGLGLWGFRWFGTYPASNGLLYTWDFAKNITFPGGIITGSIVPRVANAYTCGIASNPWAGGYTQTAFTITSDAEKKQDIAALSDQSELLAAGDAMLDALCTYRLRDAVAAKGESARTHLGHTYQSVEQALVDAGVDAERIGILCGKEPAQETVQETDVDGNPLTDEQGNPVTKTVPAVDDYGNPVYVKGLRYGELYALLAAALAHRIKKLDARVAALEA